MFKKRVLMFFLLFLLPDAAMAGINQWTNIGPEGGEVNVLAVDPLIPNTLYADAWNVNPTMQVGGVFKSTDGGANRSAVNDNLTLS